jgi:hypothetical protein
MDWTWLIWVVAILITDGCYGRGYELVDWSVRGRMRLHVYY